MTMFKNATTYKNDDIRLLKNDLIDGLGTGTTGACTYTSSKATVNGSVAANAFSVIFTTSEDFTGTINGVERFGNTSFKIEAPNGRKLPAINYEIVTGSIYIDKLT